MTNNERIHMFLLCAKSFKKAADTIWPLSAEAKKKIGQAAPPEDLLLVLPTIALLALTIELYLKMLIALDKECQPKRTHKLDELFNDLNTDTQDQICKLADSSSQQIRNFLEQHRDAFQESRYLVTMGGKDETELNEHLLMAFCETCSKLASERWKEHNA